jgi:hypothetical protein
VDKQEQAEQLAQAVHQVLMEPLAQTVRQAQAARMALAAQLALAVRQALAA